MEKTLGKTLGTLCEALGISCPNGADQVMISGITDDSRAAGAGMLFVAVAGMRVDGHRYIGNALENGCAAVLVSQDMREDWTVPMIRVKDTSQALGILAAAFYDYPGSRMTMIGITGTNGKTTSSYLLESVIRASGGTPGVIGTVAVRFQGHETPASLTTPQPVELQKLLWRMREAGVTHVVMEVSSHALAQHRVNGLLFDVALFTNISRDHLDFHGTMENYFCAKEKLFADYLKNGGRGVLVLDSDPQAMSGQAGWIERLTDVLGQSGRKCYTCGIGAGDIAVEQFHFDLQGITAHVAAPAWTLAVKSPLVGEFNLKNIVGVIGCGVALGFAPTAISSGIGRLHGVPGRLERVVADEGDGQAGKEEFSVFVDYAHTPDALEKVLQTLRELNPARLIVVFGCGGDRDRGKRALMGNVAGRMADVVVITSDNPRSEAPAGILEEIEKGVRLVGLEKIDAARLLQTVDRKGYDVVEDRAEAIRIAVCGASKGDVVLISGKGHECYQIIGDKKFVFDDRQQAREQLRKTGKAA
ncbi:MAG: UDP-N-acetylmuramoyl-L-alanyl-D-glutamate--2,6-diaminopimelate ligase [Desulfobulbaceae bacterium DB1]|nr:MAG: UDP-N-acetylmuramoyl-L-alanyl-D-glutamate--2,6-diaminopimelate ligase [Desulfobulbaceae bacterium DB1]